MLHVLRPLCGILSRFSPTPAGLTLGATPPSPFFSFFSLFLSFDILICRISLSRDLRCPARPPRFVLCAPPLVVLCSRVPRAVLSPPSVGSRCRRITASPPVLYDRAYSYLASLERLLRPRVRHVVYCPEWYSGISVVPPRPRGTQCGCNSLLTVCPLRPNSIWTFF